MGIHSNMVGIAKMVSVSIVSIENTSIGLRLGISRPLAIVMSIMVGIWVSIVSMVSIAKMVSVSIVAIENTSISTCFSFTGSSGEHAQGNNSNGFHHFVFAS